PPAVIFTEYQGRWRFHSDHKVGWPEVDLPFYRGRICSHPALDGCFFLVLIWVGLRVEHLAFESTGAVATLLRNLPGSRGTCLDRIIGALLVRIGRVRFIRRVWFAHADWLVRWSTWIRRLFAAQINRTAFCRGG